MKKVSLEKIYLPLIVFLGFIGLWQYTVNTGVYSTTLLPGPLDVAKAFKELFENGMLFEYILVSLWRLLAGYSLGIIIAVPLGLAFALSPKLWIAFEPFIQVIRPISPIAWFPFIGLWLDSNISPIFIIFLASFFPILLSTVSSFRSIEDIHLKVSKNFGLTPINHIRKVILPSIFPSIIVGLRIALGTAWIHLVAGEMMGVRSGLGYLILDSRNMMRTDLVIASMVLIGLLGLMLDQLIRYFEGWVFKKWGQI